jgi:hemerythrin-like domain-containing protein
MSPSTLKVTPFRLTEMTTASRPTRRPVMLPGHSAPAAGFEEPFEMLATCHERVERMLKLQARLQQHLLDKGCDASARQAARDVMRYFDIAAPLHHQDEELHVFPVLLSGTDETLHRLVASLLHDHRQMEVAWTEARSVLLAIVNSPESDGTLLTEVQNTALAQFAGLYRDHLDAENGVAYPAAQAALSPEAVIAMSEDMMQRRGVSPVQP